MPANHDASQDIEVRRLLVAFNKPIEKSTTWPNGAAIHAHLKSLCPDLSIPLQDKESRKHFEKRPIPLLWEKKGTTFQKAVDSFLEKYLLPDSIEKEALARQLHWFFQNVDNLECSDEIAKAIETIADQQPEEQCPDDWADEDYVDAKAALEKFIKLHNQVSGGGEGSSSAGGGSSSGEGGSSSGGGGSSGRDPPNRDSTNRKPDECPDPSTEVWPLFTKALNDGTIDKRNHAWKRLAMTCHLDGCDWADVKTALEFYLRTSKVKTDEALRQAAADFQRTCPEALDLIEASRYYGDTELWAAFAAYRERHPRAVKPRGDDRRTPSRQSKTPAVDRITYTSRPKKATKVPGWNKIWVNDPDQGGARVEGTIEYSWDGWLDVLMPPLKDQTSGFERYNIFPTKLYPKETKSFRDGDPERCLTKGKKEDLDGYEWSDLSINHWTYAKTVKVKDKIPFPRIFAVGFIKTKDKDTRYMTCWVRSILEMKFTPSTVRGEFEKSREEAGLLLPRDSKLICNSIVEVTSDSEVDDEEARADFPS